MSKAAVGAAVRPTASAAAPAQAGQSKTTAATAGAAATGKAGKLAATAAKSSKLTRRPSAAGGSAASAATSAATTTGITSTPRRLRRRSAQRSRVNLVLVVLSVLSVIAAAAVTVLVVRRVTTPPRLDPELLPAASAAYSAMYTFDYTDPDGSAAASLAVLTGDLRARFEDDLNTKVIPSYLEVSASTRVDNITVGLQSINDEQTEAVVIAYGTFVVKSVNSGQQTNPAGSECAVTDDGADACVQTLQLNLENVDGTWLVSNVTTLTTA